MLAWLLFSVLGCEVADGDPCVDSGLMHADCAGSLVIDAVDPRMFTIVGGELLPTALGVALLEECDSASTTGLVRRMSGVWEVSSMTDALRRGVAYGEVPPNAVEVLPARPLELGRIYLVELWVEGDRQRSAREWSAWFTYGEAGSVKPVTDTCP